MIDVIDMDIGSCIDKLYDLRAQRLLLDKEVTALKSDEAYLRVHIIRTLEGMGLDGGKGRAATAAISYSDVPNVTDWEAVQAYIVENDAFDLMQRRLSNVAVRDRWTKGVELPGMEKVPVKDLSLTKRPK